jgi:hypothetical protein
MTPVVRCILLWAGLTFVGCSSDRLPSGVYGQRQMEEILWDMMRVDRFSTQYLLKDSAKISVKGETLKLYQEVFRRHHTTKQEFDKSLTYYFNRPDLSRAIFDSIASRATREKESVFKNIQ